MKNYANFREYFSGQLWAIRPEMLSIMSEVLQLRIEGKTFTDEEMQARIASGQSRSAAASSGSIAVLPLYGAIDQKVSFMQEISGGTSINSFMKDFRSAIADESVKAIVFDIDSPGGSVAGIQEAAAEIFAARGAKPIVAVANTMIASAAYWIACAADEIYCMPSGNVGSIGVLAVHDDVSAANEKAGYKPTYITSSKYKAEANSDTPLSEDARQYRQNQVNAMDAKFTRDIAKYRSIQVDAVRSDFGQGRMLMAKDALAVKMIDGIATVEQVIQNVAKSLTATSTESVFRSEGLMSDTKQAAEAMSGIAKRFTERKEKREITKGMSPEEALTDSNLEAIRSAHAATCDVSVLVEDAKSSLAALLEPTAVVTTQAETEQPDLLGLERSRLELAIAIHNKTKV